MKITTYNFKELNVNIENDLITLNNQNFVFMIEGDVLKIDISEINTLSLTALELLFGEYKNLRSAKLNNRIMTREEFYQTPNFWSKQTSPTPELWNRSTERPHPIRNDNKEGILYQRYIPLIQKTFTIRGTDIEKDLDMFHMWHNQPRVAEFWEMPHPKEEIKSYMEKLKADPHMIPTIIEFDGRPIGYFEMYWTMEDRLGPYYEADGFDRGFHFLIGEVEALGFNNTDAVLKSALHYLFLNDPRTRKVMAEPRHDNKKVLRYAQYAGWSILKEFDFPHKRAALLECKRSNFFNGENP